MNRPSIATERWHDDPVAERYGGPAFGWGRPAEATPIDETAAAAQRDQLAAELAAFDAYPTKKRR